MPWLRENFFLLFSVDHIINLAQLINAISKVICCAKLVRICDTILRFTYFCATLPFGFTYRKRNKSFS